MKARMNDGASCASRIARILDTIGERDGTVGAYCEVLADQARADAARMDLMPLDQRGPLCGVGVGIKEVFDVAGGLCGWGSDIHAGRRPKHDAVIVRALRDAGGVILGTTTSTEYAMARMAPTTNPFDPTRTPGASSSGSAAAVAARMADVAIGTQTIGSGIRPAAYCGVFGYKPTQGAFSLSGAMPLADILDHPVIFANEMALIVKTFTALRDSNAAYTARWISKDNRSPVGAHTHAAIVAPWFKDAFSADVWEMVRSLARQIPDIDCTLLSLPDQIGAREEGCLTTILSADMWRHHGADYRQHPDKMSSGLRTWLERGRDIKAEGYRAALDLRAQLIADVWEALREYNFVVTLATTDLPPLRSEGTGSRAPQRLWNLIGCPAISGPIGKIAGLPVGLQIVSRPGSDAALLEFAGHVFHDTEDASPTADR